MSNARIQFSLASEDVWNAYNPQLKEGEIVTVSKANKKVKLVQGKVGGSTYSESTVIWDEDLAETTMSRAEAAAVTATAQANAASGSASKAAASQAAAATSATNAKASENAAKTSEINAKASEATAKNSATSAASSASTASTQAGKAADSATAAAGSATQAGTFATTATNKATAADKSATAADKSATAAAASAVTASDKASAAATSATNAAVSATSAVGAAEEAQGLISKAEYGFLERNKKYAVGDIAYTTQLPAGYYLECVTAGTTGNTEPSISVESENVNDGSVQFKIKDIRAFADEIVPITNGGTGADNAQVARKNLGLAIVASSGDYNDLSNKPNIPVEPKAYIVETYRNRTEWYRVWSDGWLEQGAYIINSNISENAVHTLLKPFKNTDYTLLFAPSMTTTTAGNMGISEKNTTSFKSFNWQNANIGCGWYACGQGA